MSPTGIFLCLPQSWQVCPPSFWSTGHFPRDSTSLSNCPIFCLLFLLCQGTTPSWVGFNVRTQGPHRHLRTWASQEPEHKTTRNWRLSFHLPSSPPDTLRSHHCSCLHNIPTHLSQPASTTSAQPKSPPQPAPCYLILNLIFHLLPLVLIAVISQPLNSKLLKEAYDRILSSCGSVAHAPWGWVPLIEVESVLHKKGGLSRFRPWPHSPGGVVLNNRHLWDTPVKYCIS